MSRPERRHYPTACTSFYCPETDCPEDCRNLPELRAFKAWRDETKAIQPDPDWAPLTYEATVEICQGELCAEEIPAGQELCLACRMREDPENEEWC